MISSVFKIVFQILSIVIPVSIVVAYYKNERTKIVIQKICSNPNLKKLGTIIIFMVPLYFSMAYFEILTDYLYLLEFVLIRLALVSLFLMLLQVLLELLLPRIFRLNFKFLIKIQKVAHFWFCCGNIIFNYFY